MLSGSPVISIESRIKNLVQMEDLFTFFSFPTAIRQTIYSTNLIESFNKSLKKMVRRKEQFPTDTVTSHAPH